MKGIITSKYDYIYRKIKEEIIHGDKKSGELLSEKELCERFDVSRSPVKQALNELLKDGLAEMVPHKGVFVTEIKLIDALEIYRLREVLDPLAMETSILENRKSTLEKMQSTIKSQEAALEDDDYQKYLDMDMEFHKAYLNGCQNRRLRTYLEQLIEDSTRFSRVSYNDSDRARASIVQHKVILSAYEKGDLNAAKAAAGAHMIEVREYFKRKL